MPLRYSGVVACERCGRSMRVLWPTMNAPWDSLVPQESRDALTGWRFQYATFHSDAEVFCPDHATEAAPEAHIHR
jgi:hypothetical protein